MIEKEDVLRFIQADSGSYAKTQARRGRRYFEGRHDIKDYQMFYYDADGELVRDVYRTNAKIAHPFFETIVKQRSNYLLGADGEYVISKDARLNDELQQYFDDELRGVLKELIESVQVEGWGFLYRYLGENGRSRFQSANGLKVIEISARMSKDGDEYLIYYCTDKVLTENNVETEVMRVQLWTRSETYYYVVEGNTITLDTEQRFNPRPHVVYSLDDGYYYDTFGELPFYRIDNNGQQSDLHTIKDMIDDYDVHACSITNDIQDFSSAIYFVKGNLQGDELDRIQKNLKSKKIAGLPMNGEIEVKTVDIPYEARQVKIEMNEQNIYHFGFGFNPNQLGDGNITNVVIRSRYTQLSLKCNEIEGKLRTLMKRLVVIVLGEINKELGTGYTLKDVEINFERNIVTNELDDAEIGLRQASEVKVRVDTYLSLIGVLGEQKVLEMVASELDIDVSDVELDTLRQAQIDLFSQSNALLGAS